MRGNEVDLNADDAMTLAKALGGADTRKQANPCKSYVELRAGETGVPCIIGLDEAKRQIDSAYAGMSSKLAGVMDLDELVRVDITGVGVYACAANGVFAYINPASNKAEVRYPRSSLWQCLVWLGTIGEGNADSFHFYNPNGLKV